MNDSTALAPMAQHPAAEREAFELVQRKAKCYSSSELVPTQYRGDKGIANCVIAMEMAARLGCNALMVMQNLYIVQGKPSWSAQFIIAAVNACGRFHPLRFERAGEGVTRSCIAWTLPSYVELGRDVNTLGDAKRAGLPVLEGPAVTAKMVKDEGWLSKNGSKWQTMPEVMYGYRAATFFGRLYCPEILMGLRTVDELHDIEANVQRPQPTTSRLTMPAQSVAPNGNGRHAEQEQRASEDQLRLISDAAVRKGQNEQDVSLVLQSINAKALAQLTSSQAEKVLATLEELADVEAVCREPGEEG